MKEIYLSSFLALAQKCNCAIAFKRMKIAFEENDAGYKYILNEKGTDAYEVQDKLFKKQVADIINSDYCVFAIRQWAKFFRVGHFGFIVNQDKGVGAVKRLTNAVPTNNIPTLRKYDSTTVYLRIPTFDFKYKRPLIV